MKHTLEYAGWQEGSCDDGPGVRSVLFLQGCSKNCKGCHNAGIKEHGKGIHIQAEELVKLADAKCCNKKITISGGEPLEQYESLVVFLKMLKQKGYNICLYTGWERNLVPEPIFDYIDYMKTGEFLEEQKDPSMQYAGSKNQHMYQVCHGTVKEIKIANEAEGIL